MNEVSHPEFRDELLRLGEEDQAQAKGLEQLLKRAMTQNDKDKINLAFLADCHKRAERMLEILHNIKEPTISNIGEEASSIVSLLALHSYLDEMKVVLAAFKKAFEDDPDNVYKESIPSLTDRIMVLESRTQLFGNNWSLDENGKFYLIPVVDFAHMNERRALYGLGPRMRPRNLSVGAIEYPLGKGQAQESDQREMSDDDHKKWLAYHIRG